MTPLKTKTFPKLIILNLILIGVLGILNLKSNFPTLTALTSSCFPPISGDWNITENCTFDQEGVEYRDGNLILSGTGTLFTITNIGQMALKLTGQSDNNGYHILIKEGAQMLIEDGGKVISGFFPRAVNDFDTTPKNTSIEINILGGKSASETTGMDFDPDLNTFYLKEFDATSTASGTISEHSATRTDTNGDPARISIDGFLEYTPPKDFIGEDSFTYTIVDVYGLRKTATANIIVEGPIFDAEDYWTSSGEIMAYNGNKSIGINTAHVPNFYKMYINGDAIFSDATIRNDAIIDGSVTTKNLKITGRTDIDKLQIGATPTPAGFLFSVDGNMIASDDIVVEHQMFWPDYVFALDYNLQSLENLENYITQNKPLPGFASAEEIEANQNGISLGDMQATLLQK